MTYLLTHRSAITDLQCDHKEYTKSLYLSKKNLFRLVVDAAVMAAEGKWKLFGRGILEDSEEEE